MNRTQILVTGGAGYIGTHACVALVEAGYDPVVLDNFSNSSAIALSRVEQITGSKLRVCAADIGDRAALAALLDDCDIRAVIHFAGWKSVGESCAAPLAYYHNNVAGTLVLLQVLQERGIGIFLFSSSATVYGEPARIPVDEDCPLRATNPYGQTKLIIERILGDLVAADKLAGRPFWNIALLRYFNPVGAHASSLIGEDPVGIPNNLLPYIARVAAGDIPHLRVFGRDYPTRDGTGVRDYIHVMDLVDGHIAALRKLMSKDAEKGLHAWNLGTGRGYSVLEMIAAFETAAGVSIPFQIEARRPGDIAECWADPTRAERDLNWRAARGIDQMMRDTWRWQAQNPKGYR